MKGKYHKATHYTSMLPLQSFLDEEDTISTFLEFSNLILSSVDHMGACENPITKFMLKAYVIRPVNGAGSGKGVKAVF